ncbi:P-loop NTPase fold protein [Actinoplanes sp. NPDC023714]|uniref:KAP family P-loop NTPase fold protein n=1 Tax=Actinoplanes sp. NPDC023714 TaxID=3154322 RepID=UPI0033F9608B
MADHADSPILKPGDDLLAMTRHAVALADRLARDRLPFTLGVYGAWGEGKTTFAHLVTHHLRDHAEWNDLRFVDFSAWPYVTADAIWRALLETVAREVYQPADPGEGDLASPSLRVRLRRALLRPLLPQAEQSDGERSYQELMARLGRATALTTRTSRDAEAARQFSVLSGFALDVAATAAPPLASLRGLFGKGEEAGRAAAARNREVQGIEEMRRAVRDLFRDAGKPRTVVLVDDLDRCLPEVAFDVLETLKVFLAESTSTGAECLFIIAVDRKVLERGLTARLGSDDGPQGAYARRYLEKIIQRGVSVADVRDSSPGRLIGGHFPEWVGAADLLHLATQGNPRRLKQQCDLLSLHYDHEGAGHEHFS